MDAYQIILGTTLILLILIVPGLAITLALMPRIDEIRKSERLGLSLLFGLLPYLILHFLTKNISLQITETSTLATIAAVTLISLGVWRMRVAKGLSPQEKTDETAEAAPQ